MCGIAGIVHRADTDLASLIRSMCEAVNHRGPDGGGVAISYKHRAAIGMTRLAVVDVEHGHQPMWNDDQTVAIVHNGEIYNAPALRAALQKDGVRFKTHSDTEVVLRLYERDPEALENKLFGMWAFAILDLKQSRVRLSRDRFGIKPLLVRRTPDAIAFASELRSFRALGPLEIDPGAAHAMLAWSYVPGDKTIDPRVTRIAPGHRATIHLETRELHAERYYRAAPSEEASHVRTMDEAAALVDAALARSTREHLESDVPIAAFVSGGIDSALIAAHAREASSRPIEGFSIGFHEARFDESPFARTTAEKIGMPLTVTMLDESTARRELASAMLAYDEPFGDSSNVATYLLSKTVAQTHKVALGGDGGDEVFAGYAKHRIVAIRDVVGLVPPVRSLLERAIARLPSRTDRSTALSDLSRRVARLGRGLTSSDAHAYVNLTQVRSLAETSPLVRVPASDATFIDPLVAIYEEGAGASALTRTLGADLLGPLPSDMLTKVDRASMACHLEARVPFLDHRIVEIGLGLPRLFTLGRRGKSVLRELHRRRFGDALADRPKQGFGVPVERWLRGALAPACDVLFAKDRLDTVGILSSEALGEGRWRTWAEQAPQVLWHAFALACFLEANVGAGDGHVRELLSAPAA